MDGLREFFQVIGLKRACFTKEPKGLFAYAWSLELAGRPDYSNTLNFYIPNMSKSHRTPGESQPSDNVGKLKSGALLLARDMSDPNFQAAAVLICQHGNEGSYGLVLNRPSHMPLSEIFDKPMVWAGDIGRKQKVYIGGPVQPEELQILQVTEEPVPGSICVSPSVYLGGDWSEQEGVLDADTQALRMFLGYSGWGSGQLAQEVELKAWEIWTIDVKRLLLAPESIWQGGPAPLRTFLASL